MRITSAGLSPVLRAKAVIRAFVLAGTMVLILESAFIFCPFYRRIWQDTQAKKLFCLSKRTLHRGKKRGKILLNCAIPRIFCDMGRPKMSLEQRLNFWVSQETHDFYAKLAIQRKQKISELLRVVLDKATSLFDENGEFKAEMPMSRDDLQRMMREVAAEEAAKAVKGASPISGEQALDVARKAVENTKERERFRSKESPAAKPSPV